MFLVYNRKSIGGEKFVLINDLFSADVYLTIITSLNSFHTTTVLSFEIDLDSAKPFHEP